MAQLAVFTADEFTSIQVVGAQASALLPLDYRVGSDLLALAEGATAGFLYQQANILTLLSLTRAATSVGDDLDTFFADFNFPRLPATYATGAATLHRDSATTAVSVAADGTATFVVDGQTQQYIVVADGSNPNYDPNTGRYAAGVGVTDLAVTVKSDTPGSAGNVPIATELLLSGTTSGFDTATATSGFANGQGGETDTAYRARFVLYLRSLARGTKDAIGAAILSVQANLTYTIANNQDPAGNFEPGNFVVTVDDGSGSPPASLIAAVDAAVTAYQANTVSHNVRAPTVIYADISLGLVFAPGTIVSDELPRIASVVSDYVNTLPLGQSLSITRLSNVIYLASASVTNVINVMLNTRNGDLIAGPAQTIKLRNNGLAISTAFSS